MANYFKRLPDFEYVNRLPDSNLGDYITVKNIFKRGLIREDIFQNLSFFTKYKIEGDDRPDNVAFKVYGDSTLDWLVLLCNNIINVQSEWPLTQRDFDNILRKKYGTGINSEEEIYNIIYNGTHHYETIEIKNSQGVTIIPAGLIVPQNFSVGKNYYDFYTDSYSTLTNATVRVTNYEYEEKLENNKRNIFLLKPIYINVVVDDLEELMKYRKGATQYVSDTLKRGDNIRLYE